MEQQRELDPYTVLFCLPCEPDAFDRTFSAEVVGFLSRVSLILCVTY